jgi:hypothetical protein
MLRPGRANIREKDWRCQPHWNAPFVETVDPGLRPFTVLQPDADTAVAGISGI